MNSSFATEGDAESPQVDRSSAFPKKKAELVLSEDL